MKAETVWVATTGEYESYGIFGIFKSPRSAIARIKEVYKEPYIVSWVISKGDDSVILTGDFEEVLNYSTKHTDKWFIELWEVL